VVLLHGGSGGLTHLLLGGVCVQEMRHRHDWFSIVFTYSRSYSRPFRVTIILTTLMALTFNAALLYSLTNPTGNCDVHKTKAACLSETYSYDSSKTYCRWVPDRQQCLYVQADENNYFAMVLIAVVSSMLTLPVNQLIGIIMHKLVSARVFGRHVDALPNTSAWPCRYCRPR
jgi:hypothetical protein